MTTTGVTARSARRLARLLSPYLAILAAGASVGALLARVSGGVDASSGGTQPAPAPDAGARAASSTAVPCPPGSLSDDGPCVPVPDHAGAEPRSPHLERLPSRPEPLAAYETPVPGHKASLDASGAGVFVSAPAGSPVLALGLEGQTLDARLLATAGPDAAVVSLHEVARAGTRRYLVEYSGLALAPGVGDRLAPGSLLGRVAANAAGVGVRIRQLRLGADDPVAVPLRQLLGDGHSISCDPRNVLRLLGDGISGSGSTAPGDTGARH